MPGNFPLVEFRNFDSWIPTTDIDGIDAKANIIADVSSMDFENGFIQNSFGSIKVVLPTNVSADISAGYSILSSKKFSIFYSDGLHNHTVYILYKGTTYHYLKVYVDDNLLCIDGDNDYIITDNEPNNINYNFANNSLKINLNCKGTFASIIDSPVVILNLSLDYIENARQYYGIANLINDGNFSDTIVTEWTLATGITISDGTCNFATVNQWDKLVQTTAELTIGTRYRLEFTIKEQVIGSIAVDVKFPNNYDGTYHDTGYDNAYIEWATVGAHYLEFEAKYANFEMLAFGGGHNNNYKIDNIVVYALPGYVEKQGFSLCPRWIGWQYNNDILTSPSENGSAKEANFNNVMPSSSYNTDGVLTAFYYIGECTYNVGVDDSGFRRQPTTYGSEIYGLYAYNDIGNMIRKNITISSVKGLTSSPQNIRDIKSIKFSVGVSGARLVGVDGDSSFITNYDLAIYNAFTGESFYRSGSVKDYGDVEIDVDLMCVTDGNYIIDLSFTIPVKYSNINGYVYLYSFEIIPHKLAIVLKTDDGQRGLVHYTDNTIANDYVMQFPLTKIDWRILAYEVYAEKNGIYYLSKSMGLSGAGSVMVSGVSIYAVLNLTELTSTTLNYNYNLPETKRVDNQSNIHSEVTHKGRVYFINNDYKVYQSHISANGAIQPDAFPYDEDTGFGYFIINKSKQNKALAITPDNNLGIFTSNSFYVYFIQASGTGLYKQLKLISGSVGISSVNSLTRTLDGEPTTDGLFWSDINGVYAFFGGIETPINLLVQTHENYWNAISDTDKEAVVMFYNSKERELWVCFNTFTKFDIMIYEIPYKKWKKKTLSGLFQEYCGTEDNIFYYRYINDVYKYDYSVYKAGNFTTHKHTPNVEDYWNILQEMYIILDDTVEVGELCYLIVHICYEGTEYSLTYVLNTDTKFNKLLMPLATRFKSIYFDFITYSSKLIRLKSVKYSYTEDNNEILGQNVVHSYDVGFGISPFGENEFGN